MPAEVLVLAARYIAIFGLVVSVLLIFTRWRFPQHSGGRRVDSGSGGGSAPAAPVPSMWQILWHTFRKARARDKERSRDLRAVRGKSVLVVDPDEKSAKVLIWRLEQLGCKVTKVRTGSQAIGLADSADVVISDALLPDISAVDFCRELEGSGAAIVLVGVRKGQREELAKLGDGVARLGKPYDPDDAAALAGRHLRFMFSDCRLTGRA